MNDDIKNNMNKELNLIYDYGTFIQYSFYNSFKLSIKIYILSY